MYSCLEEKNMHLAVVEQHVGVYVLLELFFAIVNGLNLLNYQVPEDWGAVAMGAT